jgi:L-threonylcarbamoyladenylate synthase
MKTEVLRVDPSNPEPEPIARAASVLRAGGLVAFPTETVYGLGANALDPAAVERIFAAKGRPANNPLIVHVAEAAQVSRLATAWPEPAARLAEAFWPGPLTLVLPKTAVVPDIVTAGGPTVAVRLPAHPVALALLRACDLPLAAPSANPSNRLSPTRAVHVLEGLAGRIDLILDGGPTQVGLESTVLDLTCAPPRLLRPGGISPTQIEAIIGPLLRSGSQAPAEEVPRSPGQLARHSAPRTSLLCLDSAEREQVAAWRAAGQRIAWLTFGPAQHPDDVPMPADPVAYAARLYATLHELDARSLARIVVELPPETDAWLAIRDRLRRASWDGS